MSSISSSLDYEAVTVSVLLSEGESNEEEKKKRNRGCRLPSTEG